MTALMLLLVAAAQAECFDQAVGNATALYGHKVPAFSYCLHRIHHHRLASRNNSIDGFTEKSQSGTIAPTLPLTMKTETPKTFKKR